MPAYDNSIAVTSQTTTVSSRVNIPYGSISLIPNITHVNQLEIERVFAFDRNDLSAPLEAFLKDKTVSIENKRKVFLIPKEFITYNDTNKTLTIADLAVTQYDYTTADPNYIINVPPITGGDDVVIRRKTISNTPLVIWNTGTKLTSNQLNLETTQLLYIVQEILDRVYYQMLLNGDIVANIAEDTIYTDAIQVNAVTASKIASSAITNDKIAGDQITYDKINTTTSPWAVALFSNQTINGIKTLANAVFSDSLRVNYGVPSTIQGKQHILSYNGDGNGGVQWEENNPWGSIPTNIVQTSGSQTFTGNKTFGSDTTTTFDGAVKLTQAPEAGKAIVSTDNNGTFGWSSVVNSIKLGGSSAITGDIEITPDSIGALATSGGTVTGSVIFTQSVVLGDAIQDNVEIQGTFKVRPDDTNPTPGNILMADAGGSMSFVDPNAVLDYVKQVNGKTGNTITLNASDVSALSTTSTSSQTVAGPVSFTNALTLGNNTTDNINIEGTLKYLPGVTALDQAGKVLTSTSTGEVLWSTLPPTGMDNITLGSTAYNNVKSITITASSIGAISNNTNENITGIKTFTNGCILSGQLNYNVGSTLNGKVLTSDGSGNASWQPTAATGITSLTMGGISFSGSAIEITTTRINALSTNATNLQTIASPVTFNNNIILGSTSSAIEVKGGLTYSTGVVGDGTQAGKVLTSTATGEVVWTALPPTGMETITLGSTAYNNVKNITITAASINAASTNTNENITGTKTFTSGLVISNGQLNYNVGSTLNGKVLTSDGSGNASWQTPAATGITSITMGGTSYATSNVDITAASINAVSADTNSIITGNKTFTGNVTLGSDTSDIIKVTGQLNYTPNGSEPTNGLVLMSTSSGNAVWQTPDTTGFITPSTIGQYIPAVSSYYTDINNQLPKASTSQYGVVKIDIAGGLQIADGKLGINPQYGTLPIATDSQLGGIKIGSGLTINSSSGVVSVVGYTPGSTSVNSFNTRIGAITSNNTDYTATPGLTNSVQNALDLSSDQEIAGIKTFKANQIISGDVSPSVGGSGKRGIELSTTGLIKAQGSTSTDKVFEGYSSSGGSSSWIKGDGNAYFDGLIEANGGFKTNAGVTLGNTTADSLVLAGTIKITQSKALGYVLTCTNATDGTAEWAVPPTAPVTSVNTFTGAVKIRTDNLYNAAGTAFVIPVTLSESQTITGAKQFDGTANFTNHVTIGNDGNDILTLTATPKIPANASIGRVLSCTNNDGTAAWQDRTIVSSVNDVSPINGNVILSLSSLGGASTTSTNTFIQPQTFNGTINVTGNTTLGDALSDKLVINSTLRFPTSAGLGKYLTCTLNTTGNEGTVGWSDLPLFVKTINSSGPNTSGNFDITTSSLGAVDLTTNQSIGGNKTFTGTTLTVGANGGTNVLTIYSTPKVPLNASIGRVLSCTNNDGTAAWQDRTIVSSVNDVSPVNGNVILSLSSLGGASTTSTNTFTASQNFSNNVSVTGNTTLGDALSDKLVINSTLRFPNNAGLGKYLTCTLNTSSNEGTVGWSDLPLLVKTINSSTPDVNGNFNITTSSLGAVDLTTNQSIGGNKTFTGTTTTFDNAVVMNGAIDLGNAAGDSITIKGTLKGSGLGSIGENKVLTSDGSGNITLQNPLVSSVRGTTNSTSWAGRTGDVVLSAADVGAASTADLAATNTNVTTAQTQATTALSTANTAQTTANGKLSSVVTTTTTIGGVEVATLSGAGTTSDPLKVLRAIPHGPASGDLSGTYPNPTIVNDAVTFTKIQNISTNRLLGRKDSGSGDIQEIQLGSGLMFNGSSGVLDCTVTGGSALLGGGTSATPQVWGGYNTFSNATIFSSTLTIASSVTADSGSITNGLVVGGNTKTNTLSIGSTNTRGVIDVTDASQSSNQKQVILPHLVTIGHGSGGYGSIGYNLDYRTATSNTALVKSLANDTAAQLEFYGKSLIYRNSPTVAAGVDLTLTERFKVDDTGISTPGSVVAASVSAASVTTTGDIYVNGGDLNSTANIFNLLATPATTINIGASCAGINIGKSSGAIDILGTASFGTPPTLTATTFNATNQIVNKGYVDGTSSKQVTGYTKLPNGILMQWGETSTLTGVHGTNYTITYPTSFSTFWTNTFVVQNNALSTGTTVQYLHGKTTATPKTTFIVQTGTINGGTYACTVRWFAIGLG